MNKKKELLKNTVIIFLGKACTQLISFLLLPLYTGFLSTTPNNSITDEQATSLYHGVPCNLQSTRESNGLGCAYYALRNKCPYDDTKTYWECLK